MSAAHDPYAPPAAPVRDLPSDAAPFYVVSPTKLVVLYICTLGLYQLFWFYMHWQRWRATHRETIWPLPRAVFALFYVHALNRRITRTLGARTARLHWWPATLATVYIVVSVLDYVTAIAWPWLVVQLPDAWLWLEWTGVLVMPVICICMLRIQRAANAACGDPQARGNRRFTVYNAAWILLGVCATVWTVYTWQQTGVLPGSGAS